MGLIVIAHRWLCPSQRPWAVFRSDIALQQQKRALKQTLRVLMVEDSEADAELITAELERAGFDVILHRAESRISFAEALRSFAPDVVLCDHSLVSFNPRAAMDVLRATRPAVPLIVVSGVVDQRLTVECVRSGAEDVVAKNQLVRLPSSISAALAARRRLAELTPRQLQVLRCVAEGYSTPEIARQLRLSAKTVETHRTELMKRLGIHDVVRLVRFAVRVGIVSIEP